MERLKLYAGWSVLTLWMASTVLSFIDRTWKPPAELGVAAIAIVTVLFVPRIIANHRGRNHAQS